jgi:superfamily II DNA or RNA helicase
MPEFQVNDQVVHDGIRGVVLDLIDENRYRVLLNGEESVIRGDQLSLYQPPQLESRDPTAQWLWREQARLRDAMANDPAVAVHHSRIEPQPHQVGVVLRALERPRPRMILADEVGLGKTIEAGLILKELRARNLAQSTLIVVPSNVRTQWQRELQTKFNETFTFVDSQRIRELRDANPNSNPWEQVGPNVICNIETARREEHRDLIGAIDWDLVIMDEAHRARVLNGKPNQGFQLLEQLRDVGSLLLLTATPMQLSEDEFLAMLNIVQPGLFSDAADYEIARDEVHLANEALGLARMYPRDNNQELRYQALLILLNAPPEILNAAREQVPDTDLDVVEWLHSKHRLSTVMTRNRKAEIGGFQVREAYVIRVDRSEHERALEDALQDYINARAETGASTAQALMLTTYRKMLASSPRAFEISVRRRIARLKNELDEFEALIADAEGDADDGLTEEVIEDALSNTDDIDEAASIVIEVSHLEVLAAAASASPDSKADRLEEQLDRIFAADPNEKVLIFTQFLPTMMMLQERLHDRYRVSVFNGRQSAYEKDAAANRFKRTDQILISSEAGGEGRNFQFSHIMVNYDLPWNPVRVEQRIGRIDRYGQDRPVQIYNFRVVDSLDERIYELLSERIRIFERSIGPLEPVLGDVERMITEIALSPNPTSQALWEQRGVSVARQIEREQEKVDRLSRDLIMDERSLRSDSANEIIGRTPLATAQDVETFALAFISRYPDIAAVEHDAALRRIEVPNVLIERSSARGLRLARRYEGTFDPDTAIREDSLDFFALGHPLVDAMLSEADIGIDRGNAVLRANVEEPTLVVDYELSLSGIKPRVELVSFRVTRSDIVRSTSPIPLPHKNERQPFPPDINEFVARADAEMRAHEDTTYATFVEENARLADQQRDFTIRAAEFVEAHAKDRIQEHERLRREYEQRQLTGLIEIQTRNIARLEEKIVQENSSRDHKLAILDESAQTTVRHQRLGFTLLLPLDA